MVNQHREMMHHYVNEALALRKAAKRHRRIQWMQSSKALFHDAQFSLRLAKIHKDKWLKTPAIMFAEHPKQEAKIIDLV